MAEEYAAGASADRGVAAGASGASVRADGAEGGDSSAAGDTGGDQEGAHLFQRHQQYGGAVYQPGGPGERTLILRKLTDLGPLRGYAEAATSLREWRSYMRAQEIGASLPDPTLLAAALEKVTTLVNRGGPQAFRVAQARTLRYKVSGATRSCCWRRWTRRG